MNEWMPLFLLVSVRDRKFSDHCCTQAEGAATAAATDRAAIHCWLIVDCAGTVSC